MGTTDQLSRKSKVRSIPHHTSKFQINLKYKQNSQATMYYFSGIRHRKLCLESQCEKGITVAQKPESIKGKIDKFDYKHQELLHDINHHKQNKGKTFAALNT